MIRALPKPTVINFTPRLNAHLQLRNTSAQQPLASPVLAKAIQTINNVSGNLRAELPIARRATLGGAGQRAPTSSTTWNRATWMPRGERADTAAYPSVRNLIELANQLSRVGSGNYAPTNRPLRPNTPSPATVSMQPGTPPPPSKPKNLATVLAERDATAAGNGRPASQPPASAQVRTPSRDISPPPTPPKPKNLAKIFADGAAASARGDMPTPQHRASGPVHTPSRPVTPPAPPTMPEPPIVRAASTYASSTSRQQADSMSMNDQSALFAQIRGFKGDGGFRTRLTETRVLESEGQASAELPPPEVPASKSRPARPFDSVIDELKRTQGGPRGVVHDGTGINQPRQDAAPLASTDISAPETHRAAGPGDSPRAPSSPLTPPGARRGKGGALQTDESDSVMRELKLRFAALNDTSHV